MNLNCYKIVFSKRLGMLVAVGEHTSSTGKAASGQGCRGSVVVDGFVGALRFTFASVALACLSLGNTQAQSSPIISTALPQGASVSTGSATISTQGAAMAITQSTDKASINWQSFNIGSAASVNIAQPRANSVLLNRVVGNDPSQILGQLKANGQVILLNPNGVLFGKDGSVTASSFTASTFALSDADFMAGYYKYNRNGSTAAVVNQGKIETSAGGFVALIGATVTNEGTIRAPQGDVVMAAAESVTLPEELVKPQPVTTPNSVSVRMSKRVRLELDPAAINTAVNNTESGVIVTEGGQVLLQAAALSTAVASVTHSGRIDTSAPQAGAVTVLADNGIIKVDGSITANSSGTDNQGQTRKGGDIIIGRDIDTGVLANTTDVTGAALESKGGFVETSGEYLGSSGIKVKAAEWLLDPNNIEINLTNVAVTAGNSVVLAGDIASALTAGTTVTIATGTGAGSTSSATGVSQSTSGTGNTSAGTIAVNSAITSNYTGASNPVLTLSAASNITVGAAITATGSDIVLKSTGGAISNTAAISGRNVSIDNTGGTINAATGAITKGSSAGTTGAAGINVGANITASDNLNMYGLTTDNTGINIASSKTLSGGNIQVIGQTGSVYGVAVNNGASIITTGTSGDSLVRGIGASVSSGGLGALQVGNATLTAATGTTLTMNGQATTVAADVNTNTRGIRIDGTVDTYGDVTLTGTSGSNDGFLLQSGQINVRTGALKINGTIAANGGGWRGGVIISQPIYLYNGATLDIVGKAANQSAAMTVGQFEQGVSLSGAIAPAAGQTSAGDITITGYSSSAENSVGALINGNISTAGNIKIIGQALGSSTGNSVYLNSVINSTAGNVTVQSIGGKINQAAPKTISARNVIIDNTGAGLSSMIVDTTAGLNLSVGTSMGGSIDPLTGAITPGSGMSTSGSGINLSGTSTATTGNINISGVSNTTTVNLGGVVVGGNLTASSGGINIYAKDLAGGANWTFYQSAGTISSGAGGVRINVLGSGSNSALNLYGNISSTGAVNLTGNAGTGTGNGIWTSGTIGITGTSVTMLGTGGSTGGHGVNISPGASITANGIGGAVSITGNAGSGSTSGVGIVTASPGSGAVAITGPSVSLTGTGGANGGSGLSFASGTTITGNSNAGSLALSGTAKANGISGVFSNAAIVGASDVSLTGNSNYVGVNSSALINLNGGSITGASGKSINLTGGTYGGANIITNGAAVKFTNATTRNDTYSGVISNGTSTGSLENVSGGQTFTGTNTYSGATTVTAGTLQLGNNGTTGSLGSGDVTLGDAGTLAFNRTNNFAFNNKILGLVAGGGSVNQNGSGQVTLGGANTYGTTNINSGVLISSGNANAFGTGLVTVASGAQAYINDTTVANAFNITGGGTTFGGTNLGAIRLQQNAATSTGVSGQITLNGAATIGAQLYSSGANVSGGVFTLGAIGGTGPLTYQSIFDPQTFSISGAGSYSGNTTVQGRSTVKFTGTGTPGASTGSINLASVNDVLEFAGNSLSVGNQITGGGRVIQSGINTTTLTGTNSYSGTTTVSAGTLQVGNGGTAGTLGSGAVSIALGSNLSFYRSNALTVGNAISGAGALNFLGTGVQDQSDYSLSASNSLSGAINVSSSRLQLSNSNQAGTAAITVNSGAGLVYTYNAGTLTNSLSLAGNGWNEASGYLGALRIRNGSNVGSAITLTANARIGAHNDSGTVSGVISGAYDLEFNTPAGTTNSLVYLTNTSNYTGATTVNVGTLNVGNGGATGTLGSTTDVNLLGASTLAFNKNVNTTIDKPISGNGNVTATITGDLALTSNIALTGTNTINLNASGSISETAGNLAATNLYMTATNGSIGAVGNRIQSNVSNLSFSAGGDVFVTEANAVTVAGLTTANNGNIDIATTNGTLTVNAVNGINGVTTNGSGNITLTGNASSGHGISINNNITATNGDVNLTGTTASTTNFNAGIYSLSTVSAKNINMLASATSNIGSVLGYYGAGGVFNASQQLSLTGTSNSSGNGLYTYTGSYLSGTGMTLVGSSASGKGMNFDAGVTVTNAASGGISITSTSTDGTQNSIGMRGVAITNGGGNLSVTATNGNIFSDTGNVVWPGSPQSNTITNSGTGSVSITAGNGSGANTGAIDGSSLTITQNGIADVTVTTSGTGNVTAPKIINNGTGNVVIASGSAIPAGTGTGGQVLTVTGNSITQSSTGTTYIYSGQASSTGVLSNLSSDFGTLYYEGSSYAVNAGFNKTYDGTPANDLTAPAGGSVSSGAQVFFRSTTKPGFTLTLNDLSKQYGDVDPTVFVATGGVTTLTNAYAGTGGNNNFAVAVADVIPALTGPRNAGENVGAYAYVLDGSSMNTTLSAQPNLNITKRDITLTSVTAASKQYDGGTTATINGGVFANTANGETLSLSGAGVFADPNAAVGKTVSVTDVTTLGLVDGTGTWSNYNLTSTGSASGTGTITKAPLTLTVNNSSVFVTQLASSAPDNGFSYSGFLNGDSAAVFNSLPTRTFTGAASYPVAGTYNGTLSTSAVPTSTNYLVSVVPGDLTVTPADKLLITIGSQSVAYGSQTAASAGVAGAGTVTAQYCFVSNNCNAPNLVDLTLTQLSALQWKAADNTGSYVVFDTSVTGAQASGSGYLKVGNYTYTASEIAPLSLHNGNFSGRATNAGVLTVTPLAVSLASVPVSKAFDSTTALPAAILPNSTLTASNKLNGDTVDASFVSGSYASSAASSAASYSLLGVQLSGADAANYSLTNYANNTFTGTGVITGGSSSASNQAIVVPPKPIMPSDNTSGGESDGSSAGNPYLVIPSNRPNSAERCTPNTLEDCLCESQEPRPLEGLAICYQPKKTASNAPAKGRRG